MTTFKKRDMERDREVRKKRQRYRDKKLRNEWNREKIVLSQENRHASKEGQVEE